MLVEAALPKLRGLLADYTRQKSEGVAVTGIGRTICNTLNYCSDSRGLVLITGKPRLGKSFAAERWVEQHPGRARYCQTPSAADDLAFFTAIARALGITVESNAKTKNLRPRIESALTGGDVMIIFDQGEHLYPSHNYRLARPSRISWLIGLLNQGASFAVLVTPQFWKTQSDYVLKSGWAASQWVGRISKYVCLPETLPISDFELVARAWLPHGDTRSIQTIADYAFLSAKCLAAVEHTVKQANYLARQDGRDKAAWPDVARAIKTGVMPGDEALTAALGRAGVSRNSPATVPR